MVIERFIELRLMVPVELSAVIAAKVELLSDPPLPLARTVPSPVTVKLPLVLVSDRPVLAPLEVRAVNESAPPVPFRVTVVALVVVTLTSLTVTPVMAAAGSFMPVAVPDEILMPRTALLVLSVTVLRTVGRTPPRVGRVASVPAPDGAMPNNASKVVPVTPGPTSQPPEFNVTTPL